jgi:uncharacterized membrane protein
MNTKTTWSVLLLIEVLGITAACVLVSGGAHVGTDPSASIASKIGGLLLFFALFAAIFAAIMVIFVTPAFILASCLIVKRAVESAFKNDYTQVRSYLFRRWILFLPLPRYAEIVRILRHLCTDRKTKPEEISSEFSKYIVLDDWGNYVLTWEGKERMLQIVNSGWINADKAEKFTSAKTIKWAMRVVVFVAIVRGIALIIHLIVDH